jgi:hypothetical protein
LAKVGEGEGGAEVGTLMAELVEGPPPQLVDLTVLEDTVY